jgi:hypothetical protein
MIMIYMFTDWNITNLRDKYQVEIMIMIYIHLHWMEHYKSGRKISGRNNNKGNAKHGISPLLKIWPGDFDLWPWKSIGFQILLRTKYIPSLVKIHWRMLILECSQGCYRRTW